MDQGTNHFAYLRYRAQYRLYLTENTNKKASLDVGPQTCIDNQSVPLHAQKETPPTACGAEEQLEVRKKAMTNKQEVSFSFMW
jgi:hypothetical protein